MDIPAVPARDSYHVGNLAPRLLTAARHRLERDGAANLSLRALSKEVGVSATASYHHFATRHELLCHLAAQGFRELCDALTVVMASSRSTRHLERTCVAYVTFARENPALYQLMFGPDLAGDGAVAGLQEARAAAFDALKEIIRGVLGPDVKDAEAQRAAAGCWSYTHGLASLWLHGVLHTRSDHSSEQLVRRTLPALAQLVDAARRE